MENAEKQTLKQGNTLSFLFGGMEYQKRNQYDLYYNMLMKLIHIGIAEQAVTIEFRQTQNDQKCGLVVF